MHTPWFGCAVTAIAVVAASCSFPTDKASPSCATDAQLCPKSSKAATSVTCDCRCTVGLSEETGQTYDGHVAVCLPAALNGMLASGDTLSGLSALDARAFDQRVFQYCSEDVATFLRTAIRAPVGLFACAVPIHCECTTKGALDDSGVCHSDCDEIDCTKKNCPGVLWKGAKLDTSVCQCTRATACGTVSPGAERPAVCRDWATPVSNSVAVDAGAL